jgi:putative nucleotidyltransferase with HDIG domain
MTLNEKCVKILEGCAQPDRVLDHCRAVAEVSRNLALALNAKGYALDPELCWRGGLLHDIRRTERWHSQRAMIFLLEAGLRREALVVGAHMGEYIDVDRIAEKEVVYLADKLTKGTQRVTVAERYAVSIAKFQGSEEAVKAAYERRDQSLALAAFVEGILGCKLEEFDKTAKNG